MAPVQNSSKLEKRIAELEKKLENVLQENQSKLQSIFEHSPLAIMYTDAEGIITLCNSKASNLFAPPREKTDRTFF
jgi:PAS domain-containing protein